MAIDEALRQKIKDRYPSDAYLLDIPEIADVLATATELELSPEQVQSRLEATAWYRARTDKQRQAFALENSNPGETKERIAALKANITQLSTQLGKAVDDQTAGALAWDAFRNGLDDRELRTKIAGYVQPTSASAGMVGVRQLADQYMVSLDENSITDLTRKVFTGELDENGVRQFLGEMATSRFPSLGDWIKKGVVPATYFSPYKDLISKYTDTPAGQIDLVNDPTWQRIISNPTPDGPPRPMSIAEATSYVRSTKQYADSNTGKAETAGFVNNFEQMLGVRA